MLVFGFFFSGSKSLDGDEKKKLIASFFFFPSSLVSPTTFF